MYPASATWEDLVYNLARPLKTLRLEVDTPGRRWLLRSPAMAAGLIDPIWTIKELLTTVVLPVNTYRETAVFLPAKFVTATPLPGSPLSMLYL